MFSEQVDDAVPFQRFLQMWLINEAFLCRYNSWSLVAPSIPNHCTLVTWRDNGRNLQKGLNPLWTISFGKETHVQLSNGPSNITHCVIQRRRPLKWTPASVLYLWGSDVISSALTSRGRQCHWLRICQSSFQQSWLPSQLTSKGAKKKKEEN